MADTETPKPTDPAAPAAAEPAPKAAPTAAQPAAEPAPVLRPFETAHPLSRTRSGQVIKPVKVKGPVINVKNRKRH